MKHSNIASWDHASGPHSDPCTCNHDGHSWTQRCPAAAAYDREIAGRWAADHIRKSPDTQFTAEYLALAAPYLNQQPLPDNEDLR